MPRGDPLRTAPGRTIGPPGLAGLTPLLARTRGASRVRIGLIDGPVATDHPDLEHRGIQELRNARCGRPAGSCGHGTLVAGVLHARRESAAPGICPDCTLLIYPVLTDSPAPGNPTPGASPGELAAAIVQTIEAGADVINLSVGLAGAPARDWPDLKESLDLAARRGAIVVAAAGNQAGDGGSTIIRHPWVIPVAACSGNGQAMTSSNLGASLGRRGLLAPGENIASLSAGGGVATFGGSSAATAVVTGCVALLRSEFPTATPEAIRLAVSGAGRRRRDSVMPPWLDAWTAWRDLARSLSLERTATRHETAWIHSGQVTAAV